MLPSLASEMCAAVSLSSRLERFHSGLRWHASAGHETLKYRRPSGGKMVRAESVVRRSGKGRS